MQFKPDTLAESINYDIYTRINRYRSLVYECGVSIRTFACCTYLACMHCCRPGFGVGVGSKVGVVNDILVLGDWESTFISYRYRIVLTRGWMMWNESYFGFSVFFVIMHSDHVRKTFGFLTIHSALLVTCDVADSDCYFKWGVVDVVQVCERFYTLCVVPTST